VGQGGQATWRGRPPWGEAREWVRGDLAGRPRCRRVGARALGRQRRGL